MVLMLTELILVELTLTTLIQRVMEVKAVVVQSLLLQTQENKHFQLSVNLQSNYRVRVHHLVQLVK